MVELLGLVLVFRTNDRKESKRLQIGIQNGKE